MPASAIYLLLFVALSLCTSLPLASPTADSQPAAPPVLELTDAVAQQYIRSKSVKEQQQRASVHDAPRTPAEYRPERYVENEQVVVQQTAESKHSAQRSTPAPINTGRSADEQPVFYSGDGSQQAPVQPATNVERPNTATGLTIQQPASASVDTTTPDQQQQRCHKLEQRIHRNQRDSTLPRTPILHFTDPDNSNYNAYTMYFEAVDGSSQYAPWRQCPGGVVCKLSSGGSGNSKQMLDEDDGDTQRYNAEVVVDHVSATDATGALKCNNQQYAVVSIEGAHQHQLERNGAAVDIEVSWRHAAATQQIADQYPTRSFVHQSYWPMHWNDAKMDEILKMQPPSLSSGSKLAPAVALISNCYADNKRLDVLRTLVNRGVADSYGRCLRTHEMPADLQSIGSVEVQKLALLPRYKFLLAFENANIDDYVTEKYYQAFEVGVIPVYYGAPNVVDRYNVHRKDVLDSEGLPLKSYIDVNDFADADALADYLLKVASDEQLYQSYFSWKQHGWSKEAMALRNTSWDHTPCQLCEVAHQRLYGSPASTATKLPVFAEL